ncbi:fasciclin domain-containing protein [Sphingopyxis sp. GC21]|uniref:fasciclin domain-containing protein n=1 Tax=Sphingopyxis sp. GC21 TaxID=2933562 RepID=UPI0021E50260|nr:fasciclin domain-containing protein [Sphingopyxis sp. GC21]
MTKSGLFMSAMVAALALGGCNKTPEPPKAEIESGAMNDVVTASANPQVGGAAMAPDKTILANAAASPILSQLTAAVNQAGLADTLSGPGPFTLFAPNDAAFAQVPAVTRDGWARPAQTVVLAGVLKYHVVPGKLTAADLAAKIDAGGGKAVLKTLDGQDLTATKSGEAIILTSASGNKAAVTQADVGQANGIVHVIDAVLLPKM